MAAKTPMYLQIADDLQRRIEAGEFGDRPLPSWNHLAADFKVTMPIVQHAVNELRRRGLVDVKRGNGTFVRTSKPVVRDSRLSDTEWGCDLDGRQVDVLDMSISSTGETPAHIAELLRVTRTRLSDSVLAVDKRRIMWVRSYVPIGVERQQAPAFNVEEMTIGLADLTERKKLGLGPGEPVARILQYHTTADRLMVLEAADIVLDGSAFLLRSSWPLKDFLSGLAG